jgi:hypothetical protein
MAETSKNAALLLLLALEKLRFVRIGARNLALQLQEKYSRNAEYVNGTLMLIRRQFPSIDMLKKGKCISNDLVRPLQGERVHR